jgi:short-subunit dehydrogenase
MRGVTYFGKHLDMEWSAFQNLLSTNVTSVVRLMSLFAPYLIHKQQGGGIMVVSSMASLLPVPYQAAYAGSKAFVTHFTQSLRQELSDENISLTVFAPGGIDTEMTRGQQAALFRKYGLFARRAVVCSRCFGGHAGASCAAGAGLAQSDTAVLYALYSAQFGGIHCQECV